MQTAPEEKYLVINNPLNCDSGFTPVYAAAVFVSALWQEHSWELWAPSCRKLLGISWSLQRQRMGRGLGC